MNTRSSIFSHFERIFVVSSFLQSTTDPEYNQIETDCVGISAFVMRYARRCARRKQYLIPLPHKLIITANYSALRPIYRRFVTVRKRKK